MVNQISLLSNQLTALTSQLSQLASAQPAYPDPPPQPHRLLAHPLLTVSPLFQPHNHSYATPHSCICYVIALLT